MTISRQTIRRRRQDARSEQCSSYESFVPTVPLTVHWDGKLVSDEPGQEKHERLPILVSGLGVEKLLRVLKIDSGSGAVMAEEIFTVLQDWDLIDHVTISMSFDTTSSNTGSHSGACTLLQSKRKRKLLHLACRKHISEIIIDKVFNVCTGIVSNGPDVQLCKLFQQKWSSIDVSTQQFSTSAVPTCASSCTC